VNNKASLYNFFTQAPQRLKLFYHPVGLVLLSPVHISQCSGFSIIISLLFLCWYQFQPTSHCSIRLWWQSNIWKDTDLKLMTVSKQKWKN